MQKPPNDRNQAERVYFCGTGEKAKPLARMT
jgi:hypothetical protein